MSRFHSAGEGRRFGFEEPVIFFDNSGRWMGQHRAVGRLFTLVAGPRSRWYLVWLDCCVSGETAKRRTVAAARLARTLQT